MLLNSSTSMFSMVFSESQVQNNAVRASNLPELALSPVPRIDFPSLLKDTISVVEMPDIAGFSVGDL